MWLSLPWVLTFEAVLYLVFLIITFSVLNDQNLRTHLTKSYLDCTVDGDGSGKTCLADTRVVSAVNVQLKILTGIVWALSFIGVISQLAHYLFSEQHKSDSKRRFIDDKEKESYYGIFALKTIGYIVEIPSIATLVVTVFLTTGLTEIYQLVLVVYLIFVGQLCLIAHINISISSGGKSRNELFPMFLGANYIMLFMVGLSSFINLTVNSSKLPVYIGFPLFATFLYWLWQASFIFNFFHNVLPRAYVSRYISLKNTAPDYESVPTEDMISFTTKYSETLMAYEPIYLKIGAIAWKTVIFLSLVIGSSNVKINF